MIEGSTNDRRWEQSAFIIPSGRVCLFYFLTHCLSKRRGTQGVVLREKGCDSASAMLLYNNVTPCFFQCPGENGLCYGSLHRFHTCCIFRKVMELATVRSCPRPMLWLLGHFLSLHRAGGGFRSLALSCPLLYNHPNTFTPEKEIVRDKYIHD